MKFMYYLSLINTCFILYPFSLILFSNSEVSSTDDLIIKSLTPSPAYMAIWVILILKE